MIYKTMKATIVGLGLIGGSLAKDLKARGIVSYITGVDVNDIHAKETLKHGIADEIKPLEAALNSELILLTSPVNAIKKIAPFVLDRIGPDTLVIDMGSTKENICNAVRNHPNRKQFVAAHPIAGTENTGPSAAINNLFDNKICIICEKELSKRSLLKRSENIFKVLKMKLIYMDAKEHDMHLAYVSHLSHISSFALGNTVLDIEKDHKNILNLAGSGFASTVRLAKSSPDMWEPIFTQNSKNILTALEAYIYNLQQFQKLLTEKRSKELYWFMNKANKIRKVLQKNDNYGNKNTI